MSQARLTIDLDALAANYALACAQAGRARVAPVVKADAYGLGMAAVARRLWVEGAEQFFVARVAEGIRLRRILGAGSIIYVLDGCPPGAAMPLIDAQLRPVLNSLEQIDTWTAAGGGDAALHIDTGLNRLGLAVDEALDLTPQRLSGLAVGLVLSHLSCGSTPDHPMNRQQADVFDRVRRHFPGALASLVNSGGLFQGQDWAFDLARPGISLYGGGPFGRPDTRIATVATYEAPVLQVRRVGAGEAIGYDAAFRADQSLSVAVAAAGYADGALRGQSPNGYGWLHGARRRYLGRVSMDLIAIDVSDCPEARAGDVVQLLGPDVLLDDVAVAAGTISHDVLTRLGVRAERIYRGLAG